MDDSEALTCRVRIVWLQNDWPVDQIPVVGVDATSASIDGSAGPIMQVMRSVEAGLGVLAFLESMMTRQAFGSIQSAQTGVSVFGRRVRAGQLLFDGDRIELLGPIVADPKSDRRQRVRQERDSGERTVWNRK